MLVRRGHDWAHAEDRNGEAGEVSDTCGTARPVTLMHVPNLRNTLTGEFMLHHRSSAGQLSEALQYRRCKKQ